MFVIFAVTLFPRLARSLYLIFFTCFQLRSAVPIPKILIEPSKPVFQVPWFLVVSKYGANDRQQQSHSSLLRTALCHCSECLLCSQTFGAHKKKIVVISARHSWRSVEVKFSGTSSFPIKRLTASEYIGLSSILSLASFIIQGCGESIYPTKL